MQTHHERITINLDPDVAGAFQDTSQPRTPSRFHIVKTDVDVDGWSIGLDAERTGSTYSFPASSLPGPSAMLVGATINGMTCAEIVDADGTITMANMGPPPGHDPTVAHALEMRHLRT